MTDAVELIGLIYKLAKLKDIPASDFEQIITRSYMKTIKLHAGEEVPNLD